MAAGTTVCPRSEMVVVMHPMVKQLEPSLTFAVFYKTLPSGASAFANASERGSKAPLRHSAFCGSVFPLALRLALSPTSRLTGSPARCRGTLPPHSKRGGVVAARHPRPCPSPQPGGTADFQMMNRRISKSARPLRAGLEPGIADRGVDSILALLPPPQPAHPSPHHPSALICVICGHSSSAICGRGLKSANRRRPDAARRQHFTCLLFCGWLAAPRSRPTDRLPFTPMANVNQGCVLNR